MQSSAPQVLSSLKSVDDSRKVVGSLMSASGAAAGPRKGGLDKLKGRIKSCKQDWRALDQRIVAFEGLIGEQREEIAGRLREEADGFGQQCESLQSRWSAVRPGSEAVADPSLCTDEGVWYGERYGSVLQQMTSWLEQTQRQVDKAEELQQSCQAFDIPFEGQSVAASLQSNIMQYFADWKTLEEWRAGLRELTSMDWLSFRPKLFELGDLADKWSRDERLVQSRGKSSTSEPIRRATLESDWIQAAMPGLKLMKGEAFQTQHWARAFACAGLPTSTRIESLQAEDLVRGPVLRSLMDSERMKELKSIVAQAQGEITIRETLNESKAWLESARLQFTDYESPADGTKVPVVKSWQEVFADLGD